MSKNGRKPKDPTAANLTAYFRGQDDGSKDPIPPNPYPVGPLADAWQRGVNYSVGYRKSQEAFERKR